MNPVHGESRSLHTSKSVLSGSIRGAHALILEALRSAVVISVVAILAVAAIAVGYFLWPVADIKLVVAFVIPAGNYANKGYNSKVSSSG
jgi:hypothetical protein